MARTTHKDDRDTAEQAPTPPAGWYPDPTDETQQRYWDGDSWTRHVGREAVSQVRGTPPDDTHTGPVTTWERAAFVVTYFLGGLLLGPIALRHAGRAEGARAAGDRHRARAHARRARVWTIVAFVVGLVTIGAVLWWFGLLPDGLVWLPDPPR